MVSTVPYPPSALLFALADDLLNVEGSFRKMLDDAQAKGDTIAKFNFNTTDVTVDFEAGFAEISDVLYADAEIVTLPVEFMLRPFDLAVELPARCVAFVKSKFGGQWREAMVWLAAMPANRGR